MRVMVLVKATEYVEEGNVATPEMMEEMGRYNEALAKAGIILVAGHGLKPSSKGKRVAFDGSGRTASWLPASGCGKSRTWTRRSPG